MSKFYYQLKCKLDENKEDWYYLCNDAEQALFKVKEQCKDESAIKSLERMIIDLNSIRMEQYERLTEYSLVEEVVAATNLDLNDMPNELRKHFKNVNNKDYIKKSLKMHLDKGLINKDEYNTLSKEYKLNEEFWNEAGEKEYKGIKISIEKGDHGNTCYIPLRNKELNFIPEDRTQFFSWKEVKEYIDSKLSNKNLKESFEGNFEGKKIKTDLHNDKSNPVWIVGDISIDNKTYRVNAKVFLEDSEFGIENGPVSKLWIADSNGNWIINYDRGWDVKPTAETEEIYNIALGAVRSFRNNNPYEPDPEESADVKHGALTEKMNESEDVDLNNEDLITGFVNVDIGEGNDAIHFIYNKDTQEVIYTKGYAAGRVHKKTTYSELPHEEFPYTTEGIIKAYIDTKLNTINESAAYEASEHGFDQIVLDSYNHLTNDLGKSPSLEDIVDDIINNYDQTFITDESPEDGIQAIKDVRHILRKHDLTYDNLEESSTVDNGPDLDHEQVQADVDHWTEIDEAIEDNKVQEKSATLPDGTDVHFITYKNEDGTYHLTVMSDYENCDEYCGDFKELSELDNYIETLIDSGVEDNEELYYINYIKESVEDEEDWSDPNYKVDTSNLYLTNYGYHNNSDIIYGRIHLLPKDKNSKLMPGHYDVIYYCENGEFQLFELGTDVRTAVDYLYNYGSDEYDWVKWGGRRIQLDNIYEILTEEALKNVPQEQRDAIEKAINNAYYNEEPFPLNKVKYD